VGVDWGIWAMSNGRDQGELLRELLSMVDQGELTVDEPTTFPLDHGADALRDLIGRRVVGKIALTP
jgi:NADPH2:quinone reductase